MSDDKASWINEIILLTTLMELGCKIAERIHGEFRELRQLIKWVRLEDNDGLS